jgi:amino acid transporter
MDWERLRRQLASEAREYLADLRELRDGLKSAEGWIALALVVAATLMTAAWVIVSLGFNPPNEHISAMMYKLGMRTCRPITNVSGVVVIVDMFMLIFLTAVTFGNIVRMSGRVRRGLPREPRELIVSAGLMLAAGVGGILYMLWVC